MGGAPQQDRRAYGPLCRPKADAMGGAPQQDRRAYGPLCRPKADAMGDSPKAVSKGLRPLQLSGAVRPPRITRSACSHSLRLWTRSLPHIARSACSHSLRSWMRSPPCSLRSQSWSLYIGRRMAPDMILLRQSRKRYCPFFRSRIGNNEFCFSDTMNSSFE